MISPHWVQTYQSGFEFNTEEEVPDVHDSQEEASALPEDQSQLPEQQQALDSETEATAEPGAEVESAGFQDEVQEEEHIEAQEVEHAEAQAEEHAEAQAEEHTEAQAEEHTEAQAEEHAEAQAEEQAEVQEMAIAGHHEDIATQLSAWREANLERKRKFEMWRNGIREELAEIRSDVSNILGR